MTDELKQWEYDRGYEKGRADAIDEFETRILSNCSLMLKDGERVIVIRRDIFQFISEQMKKGAEQHVID